MTVRKEPAKIDTFAKFKDFTLVVARGERKVDPNEPKVWIERRTGKAGAKTAVRFSPRP